MVYADAHFRMGSAHADEGTPCQDYAVSGHGPGRLPFAIVSDGCSSSGRTDLGARVLALGAAKVLRTYGALSATALRDSVLNATVAASMLLGLEPRDMDATLGIALALPGGGVRAMLLGDGVIAARTPDGLDVRTVDWAGNMPGYPWYMLSPSCREEFLSMSRAAAAAGGRAPCLVTRFLIGPDGSVEQVSVDGLDAAEGLEGTVAEWLPGDGAGAPDSVSVMTDGALQFSGGATGAEVASALATFKAAREGEFVRRRMSRALGGFARRGCHPVDDIAAAAVAAAVQPWGDGQGV
jgi:hypothetical protein